MDLALWYTAYLIDGWRDIVSRHFEILASRGVFEKASRMTVFMFPEAEARGMVDICERYGARADVRPLCENRFEFPALEALKHDPAGLNLYFHTKGVSQTQQPKKANAVQWGYVTLDRLAEEFDEAVGYIDRHLADCVGCMFKTSPHPHYSGNFFICSGAHVQRLPYPDASDRMNAEWWVGSVSGKYMSLFDVSKDPYYSRLEARDCYSGRVLFDIK